MHEGSYLVDTLRRFNSLCMLDIFEQYQDKCFTPIVRILKNIAEDGRRERRE